MYISIFSFHLQLGKIIDNFLNVFFVLIEKRPKKHPVTLECKCICQFASLVE